LSSASKIRKTYHDVKSPNAHPQDLVNCILDGTPMLLTAADSFTNTEVMIRTQENADSGRLISI